MVEKIRNISNKKFILFSILSCLLILTIGTTYAFFTTNILGNSDAKSTQVYAGIMSLKLDGTTITSADGMYPGASHTIEFSVENTGTLTTTYELDMKEVYNDLNNSYMVYTITKNDELVKEETVVPQIDDILLPAVVIAPQEIDNYKLTITYKNSDSLQNSDEGKSFSGRVQISGIDSSNYLQAKVLARSINANEPDLKSADPTLESLEYSAEENNSYVASTITGNRAIGTGYKFNKKSGIFTLTNVKKNQTYDESSIGKYTCENNDGRCQMMYKIKKVEVNDASENYTENTPVTKTISLTSNNNRKTSESYHLDQETGYFVLDNPSNFKSYDTTDIGRYTCNNAGSRCKILYKINNVTNTKVDNVDLYSLTENSNTVTASTIYYTDQTKVLLSSSGVYKTEDDDGESYYFRGNIKNNYVSFANKLWKILRINGDGSIRLIYAENGLSSALNTRQSPVEKGVGYTYDNESNCTKESPCISDYNSETSTFSNNKTVTDSAMKTYLEDWYIANLNNYNDKIVLGSYCNDTTLSDENELKTMRYFKAYERLTVKNEPTLKCPDTAENYGGNYKLKIGLITADELNYAGLINYNTSAESTQSSSQSDKSNYLYSSNGYYGTMTPYRYSYSLNGYIFYASQGHYSYSVVTVKRITYPVINLKSDTQITGGDGTSSNPYVVE